MELSNVHKPMCGKGLPYILNPDSRWLCRLIFAGKQMNDDKMAKEYNIEGGSVLHLVSPSIAHLHFLKS